MAIIISKSIYASFAYTILQNSEPGWYKYTDIAQAMADRWPDLFSANENRKTPAHTLNVTLRERFKQFFDHVPKDARPNREYQGLFCLKELAGEPDIENVTIKKISQPLLIREVALPIELPNISRFLSKSTPFPAPEELLNLIISSYSLGETSRGEGPLHMALKEAIVADPSVLGLPPEAQGQLEFQFPTLDRCDVFFDMGFGGFAVVEVKPGGLDDFAIGDLGKGLLQAAKYRELTVAQHKLVTGEVPSVSAFLVTQTAHKEFSSLAGRIGVRLIELPYVRPKPTN